MTILDQIPRLISPLDIARVDIGVDYVSSNQQPMDSQALLPMLLSEADKQRVLSEEMLHDVELDRTRLTCNKTMRVEWRDAS